MREDGGSEPGGGLGTGALQLIRPACADWISGLAAPPRPEELVVTSHRSIHRWGARISSSSSRSWSAASHHGGVCLLKRPWGQQGRGMAGGEEAASVFGEEGRERGGDRWRGGGRRIWGDRKSVV